MEAEQSKSTRFFAGVGIFILTIIVAQQIINIFFPDDGLTRLMAKLVLDTSIITSGLIIKNKLVANSIVAAGFLRYIIIFFQDWGGGSPAVKAAVFAVVLVMLIVVGVLKFGHLNENKAEVKNG